LEALRERFPDAPAWGQAGSHGGGGNVRAADGSMAGVPEAREEYELQVGQVGRRVSNRVRRVNRNVMGE
jgi:hypothetical protein